MKNNVDKNYFKDLNRKDYIEKAYEIITNEGIKSISIRRIAKEMGCSSTCLYRYFKNLDELLFYAQMGFLNCYLEDLENVEKTWKTVWDQHLGVWECYTRAAFRYPEAFDMIFLHENSKNLDTAVVEYYNMFPEEAFDMIFLHENSKNLDTAVVEYYNMFPENLSGFKEHLKKMLETPGFYDRDFEMCMQCVDAGQISLENAKKMNHMECTLYMGYLKDILSNGIKEEDIEDRVRCFVREVGQISLENAKKMNHMECTLYMGYLKDILSNGIKEEDIEDRVRCFVREVKDIANFYADKFEYTGDFI